MRDVARLATPLDARLRVQLVETEQGPLVVVGDGAGQVEVDDAGAVRTLAGHLLAAADLVEGVARTSLDAGRVAPAAPAPARDLPCRLWMDVLDVLERHGLHAPIGDTLLAMKQLIDVTPVERGGRLRPDGTVER